MRIKTHYKKGLDVAPNLAVNIDDAAAHAAADRGTEQMLHHMEGGDSDPSAAFQSQIDALRQAEKYQREAASPQLSANQARFLAENPAFVESFANNPNLLIPAFRSAHLAGHEPDSPEFHAHVKQAFEAGNAEMTPRGWAPDRTPKFYEPKPMPEPDSGPDPDHKRGRIVSGPVSREGPAGTRASDYDGSSPSRVTLTAQEKSIARSIGQSEADYARGKIELARRKADGFYDR